MKKHLLFLVNLVLVSSASATISYQQSTAMWNQSGTSCTLSLTGSMANDLFVVWTCTGILSSNRTATGLQPKSSVSTDTCQVDYVCIGNPN